MSELERLRSELTDEQRNILTAIWSYFHEHQHWMPIRFLHENYGGKTKVWEYLEQLGGTIVFEHEEVPRKYYRLTFLGILLTEEGTNCEQLVIRYLEYVSQKCAEEPIRTQVSSQEVATDLRFNLEQLSLLGYLVREGSFYSGSASFGTDEWSMGIPDDVEDFPQELVEYVRKRAVLYYDPIVPVKANERSSYLWSKTGKPPEKEIRLETPKDDTLSSYIDETRIAELRAISSPIFDLTRLIKLCEELNLCSSNGSYLAMAMLTRALLDHIPPIFKVNTFSEVVNNYKGTKSFKGSMEHLEKSCRNIADASLHVHIRSKEILPNKTQVNFANDLDVLLAEIVRILP